MQKNQWNNRQDWQGSGKYDENEEGKDTN
jgi:hypothetical protein